MSCYKVETGLAFQGAGYQTHGALNGRFRIVPGDSRAQPMASGNMSGVRSGFCHVKCHYRDSSHQLVRQEEQPDSQTQTLCSQRFPLRSGNALRLLGVVCVPPRWRALLESSGALALSTKLSPKRPKSWQDLATRPMSSSTMPSCGHSVERRSGHRLLCSQRPRHIVTFSISVLARCCAPVDYG